MSKAPETRQVSQETAGGVDRRGFFRSLGGSAAAVAAAAGVPLATSPAQANTSQSERTKASYKESDHVKAYYRTNRY